MNIAADVLSFDLWHDAPMGRSVPRRAGRGPIIRLTVLVLGGLFALGSDELTPQKIAYLAFIVFNFCIALAGLLRSRDRATRHALLGALAMASALLVAANTGLTNGHDPLSILRDGANYVLLAMSAPLALDAGRRCTPSQVERLLVVAGLLSTVGFTIDWLTRRGLALVALPEDLLFDSSALGAALVCYASVRIMTGARRWPWLLAAGFCIALPVATGTRQALILLLAPLAVAIPYIARRRTRMAARALAVPALLGGVAALCFALVASVGIVDTEAAVDRISTITTAVQDVGGDASTFARLLQNQQAARDIREHPITGRGLGAQFYVYRPNRDDFTVSFNIDSSLVPFTKMGIVVGGAATFLLALSWLSIARVHRPRTHWHLALWSFTAVMAGRAVVSAVIKDKGVALAVVLLLAGCVAEHRSSVVGRPPRQRPKRRGLREAAGTARRAGP